MNGILFKVSDQETNRIIFTRWDFENIQMKFNNYHSKDYEIIISN